MAGDSNGHSSGLASGISTAKDLFGLLRDFALFIFAALLLVFPSTFNAILTNAGFEEGSFAGLVWKRQLVDTNDQLQKASDTITSLQTQNAELLAAAAAAEKGVTPKVSAELARLQSQGKKSADAVKQVQASVSTTLRTNDPLVEKAKSLVATDVPPSSAYCYQEDRLQAGPQRFSVHCHATLAECESARGPNPRTRQSPCESIALDGANWKPQHPGWMGSWYAFRSDRFDPPFPGLPQ